MTVRACEAEAADMRCIRGTSLVHTRRLLHVSGAARHAHQRHAVRTLLVADASEQTAARRYCMQRARRADAPDACNGRTL